MNASTAIDRILAGQHPDLLVEQIFVAFMHGGLSEDEGKEEKKAKHIETVDEYVLQVMNLAATKQFKLPTVEWITLDGDEIPTLMNTTKGVYIWEIDRSLIAVGFRKEPPRRWATSGLQRFLNYWYKAARNPEEPDFYLNNVTPEQAYTTMKAKVPSRDVNLHGKLAVPSVGPGGRIRRTPPSKLRQLKRMVLGASEHGSTADYRDIYRNLSPKALAAVGRIGPELRTALLDHLRKDRRWTTDYDQQDQLNPDHHWGVGDQAKRARISDLPWAKVSQVQKQLLTDKSGRVRAAYAQFQKRLDLHKEAQAAGKAPKSMEAWLSPNYPDVLPGQALQLAKGETPVQLSNNLLDRKEAHRWLSEAPYLNPIDWLSRQLPDPELMLRSIHVVRWLLDVGRRGDWGLLTRVRQIHEPGGQLREIRYIDRIDEISDEDLIHGVRTGVQTAFERAAERTGQAYLAQHANDNRVLQKLPQGWHLLPSMKHLDTPAKLVREGEEMNHCVGTYCYNVKQGQSIILAIEVQGNRSTVELSTSGRVRQHHGPRNSKPHALNTAELEKFLKTLPGAK